MFLIFTTWSMRIVAVNACPAWAICSTGDSLIIAAAHCWLAWSVRCPFTWNYLEQILGSHYSDTIHRCRRHVAFSCVPFISMLGGWYLSAAFQSMPWTWANLMCSSSALMEESSTLKFWYENWIACLLHHPLYWLMNTSTSFERTPHQCQWHLNLPSCTAYNVEMHMQFSEKWKCWNLSLLNYKI